MVTIYIPKKVQPAAQAPKGSKKLQAWTHRWNSSGEKKRGITSHDDIKCFELDIVYQRPDKLGPFSLHLFMFSRSVGRYGQPECCLQLQLREATER